MVTFNEPEVPSMLNLMYKTDHKTHLVYKLPLNIVWISLLIWFGCETWKQLLINIIHMGFVLA